MATSMREDMTIDLSEVSRQVGGYHNSGETAGRSAAEVAFKCITSPRLLPINNGSFPLGRVISATKPAAGGPPSFDRLGTSGGQA